MLYLYACNEMVRNAHPITAYKRDLQGLLKVIKRNAKFIMIPVPAIIPMMACEYDFQCSMSQKFGPI